MDSPSKAKRVEYVKELRSRTVVVAASGESVGTSKSVNSSGTPPGEEQDKGKGREARGGRATPDEARKLLKETLAGSISFSGDESDVGLYAKNVLAARRRLAFFAEVWADHLSILVLSTVRALLRLYLDDKGKENSFGIWLEGLCEGLKDPASLVESFDEKFFTVPWAMKAAAGWSALALRDGEKPDALLKRMRELEALMDTPPSVELATATYRAAFPPDFVLHLGVAVAGWKSPDEVKAGAELIWDLYREQKAKKEKATKLKEKPKVAAC